jgi:hypothetical protein
MSAGGQRCARRAVYPKLALMEVSASRTFRLASITSKSTTPPRSHSHAQPIFQDTFSIRLRRSFLAQRSWQCNPAKYP